MAIEDAYELGLDLAHAVESAAGHAGGVDVEGVLRTYQAQRMMRVSTIHGMAGACWAQCSCLAESASRVMRVAAGPQDCRASFG
jgi:hypothetical protein